MLFEAQQKKVSEKADPKEKRKIGKEVKIWKKDMYYSLNLYH